MALRKEIKNSRGIIGNYHRIEQIVKNHDELSVTIKTYADEGYRKKEKAFLDLSRRLDGLNEERLSLIMDERKNAARMLEIRGEFEKHHELSQIGDFGVFSTQIAIPWDLGNDISFAGIYEYLSRSDPVFQDSVSA